MIRPILSWISGIVLGLLIVAPPIDYSIPLMVNSFHWCYLIVATGLFSMVLMQQKLHILLKLLNIYLFASCFFSQAPYLSFNAYIVIVAAFYLLIFFKNIDLKLIFPFLEAAFCLEVLIIGMQLMGKDTMLNFDRPEPVFLGTVMQYMRVSSVLAVLTPFLVIRNKWYLFPIGVLCLLSQSSSFMLSLLIGSGLYAILTLKKWRWWILLSGLVGAGTYAWYDFGSFQGAIDPANGGRLISWWAILCTWCMDTSHSIPGVFSGPINWWWVFFGHGIDTFLPLFPVYKHDMNPFPQAHNSYLQLLWETGLIGFGLLIGYLGWMGTMLWKRRELLLLAGLVCLGVNAFFTFPERMTQTMFLLVLYFALCEKAIEYRY